MAAGDSARLVLDKSLHPTLPDYINGVVQQPVTLINLIDQETQTQVTGTQYIIEYETDDLNGIIPALQACDVADIECVTCCDVLGDRITQVETDLGERIDGVDTRIDGVDTRLDGMDTRNDGQDQATADVAQDLADHMAESVPNPLVGALHAFALVDQPISNTEEAIDFDTTESLSGCLTRSGSVFTTSLVTRLTGALQLQVDQLDVANVLTLWLKINGVISARSATKLSTGVLNSNTSESYAFSVLLAAADTVEFFAITSTVAGVNLDFTAAGGAIPAIPAASVILEAVSV
jgi:hypothetical protein